MREEQYILTLGGLKQIHDFLIPALEVVGNNEFPPCHTDALRFLLRVDERHLYDGSAAARNADHILLAALQRFDEFRQIRFRFEHIYLTHSKLHFLSG